MTVQTPSFEAVLKVVGDSGIHHEPRPLGGAESWRLEVSGAVGAPAQLSLAGLARVADPVAVRIPIHCVSAGGICGVAGTADFEGLPFSALAAAARPSSEARTVEFISRAPGTCGPRSRRHRTSLALEECLDPATGLLIAWKLNGEPLPYPNGGPLRGVVGPRIFFYKSVKWLEEIRFRTEAPEDVRGTWEEYAGYHNRAWVELDERFEPCLREIVEVAAGPEGTPEDRTREVPREEWQTFFQEAYRCRDLSRLVAAQLHRAFDDFPRDFADAVFSDGPYQAKIRGTSFAGADLTGSRMAGCNFSLSKFPNARFSDAGERPADLSSGDFEGTYFNRADLREVSMRGACLTNATFFTARERDRPTDRVRGLDVRDAVNLDPDTADWLRRNGARVE